MNYYEGLTIDSIGNRKRIFHKDKQDETKHSVLNDKEKKRSTTNEALTSNTFENVYWTNKNLLQELICFVL